MRLGAVRKKGARRRPSMDHLLLPLRMAIMAVHRGDQHEEWFRQLLVQRIIPEIPILPDVDEAGRDKLPQIVRDQGLPLTELFHERRDVLLAVPKADQQIDPHLVCKRAEHPVPQEDHLLSQKLAVSKHLSHARVLRSEHTVD